MPNDIRIFKLFYYIYRACFIFYVCSFLLDLFQNISVGKFPDHVVLFVLFFPTTCLHTWLVGNFFRDLPSINIEPVKTRLFKNLYLIFFLSIFNLIENLVFPGDRLRSQEIINSLQGEYDFEAYLLYFLVNFRGVLLTVYNFLTPRMYGLEVLFLLALIRLMTEDKTRN
jgi:hypothetical protein